METDMCSGLPLARDCWCRTDPALVHADHVQPGQAVWLPGRDRWVKFDWSDADEGSDSITFCPDGEPELTVPAGHLLARR